ncbi:hypothetical protein I4F81_007270 [Pyropia yezoensis]|uniref:Uncharacterized protein n=1 Tax=Pyropia yezoensis TaxID=2788 RepID=A0ACC3C4P0_PYRYE|nr:hypothetical protein I4F81_007270 [Neopyropia yezoensis]
MVVPPAAVRDVVDTAVKFVARKGAAFEARILASAGGADKFAFLRQDDPYHAYYRQQLAAAAVAPAAAAATPTGTAAGGEALAPPGAPLGGGVAAPSGPAAVAAAAAGAATQANGGKGGGPPPFPVAGVPALSPTAKANLAAPTADGGAPPAAATASGTPASPGDADTLTAAPALSARRLAELAAAAARGPPRPPPPDPYTVRLPPHTPVTPHQLDVLQLTAQAAAVTPSFPSAVLARREAGNPLFGFLRPAHPLHPAYTATVRAYGAVLCPPAGLVAGLRTDAATLAPLRERALAAADWARAEADRRAAAAADGERAAARRIDWHDFVIAETIVLDEEEANGEEAPPPGGEAPPRGTGAAAASSATGTAPGSRAPAAPLSPPASAAAASSAPDRRPRGAAPTPAGTRGGDPPPPVPPASSSLPTPSPPSDGAATAAAAPPPVAAAIVADVHADIPAHLVRAAVSGGGGTTSSSAAAAASAGAAGGSRGGGGSGHAPSRAGGGGGDAAPGGEVRLPSGATVPVADATATMRAELRDPTYKVQHARAAERTRVVNLATGDEMARNLQRLQGAGGGGGSEAWIARTGAAVELRVVVPVHPSAEWSLAGQTITAEVPLRATVGALKATLADQTRLPANKQKLLYEPAGFLKDAHTLAFYNVAPGASLTLEVKERGGRKK